MPHSSKQLFNQIRSELSFIYDADEAGNIAFLLLEHIFHLNKAAILADKPVESVHLPLIQAMTLRLKNHEPVQYVIGETEFLGRLFKVNKHVLIPRPETEELVELIIRENQAAGHLRILDIGTGSGCIAISLAASLLQSTVQAIDISAEALAVAGSNAAINQVAVQLIQADILNVQDFPALTQLNVDIIVSNPPYVTYAEQPLMRKNVTAYEPHLALFVTDNDPLFFYKHIIRFCETHLRKGGRCYVEINEQFARPVEKLFAASGFSAISIHKDMFGKERFVKGVF